MEYFLQQMINGITLGSIYGLIAIGYTMVFGIIGMVNFAHGDVFMLSTFIALIFLMALTQVLGLGSLAVALFIVLLLADAAHLAVGLGDRTPRLPALAWLLPPGAADLRHRHVDLPVEPSAGDAGSAQQAGALDPGRGDHAHRGRQLRRHVVLQADHDRSGHRRAAGGVLVSRAEHLARPGAARLRAGPAHGRAAGRRRRPHHLPHLRDRRRAGRRRRRDVHDLLRRGELQRRLRTGREGVHRGRARRYRLAARRRAGRAVDRPD